MVFPVLAHGSGRPAGKASRPSVISPQPSATRAAVAASVDVFPSCSTLAAPRFTVAEVSAWLASGSLWCSSRQGPRAHRAPAMDSCSGPPPEPSRFAAASISRPPAATCSRSSPTNSRSTGAISVRPRSCSTWPTRCRRAWTRCSASPASRSSTQSEFRHWLDNNDLPIQQTTEFQRVPLTASLKMYLGPPGRSIGRFAWIPKRFAPVCRRRRRRHVVPAPPGGRFHRFRHAQGLSRYVRFGRVGADRAWRSRAPMYPCRHASPFRSKGAISGHTRRSAATSPASIASISQGSRSPPASRSVIEEVRHGSNERRPTPRRNRSG